MKKDIKKLEKLRNNLKAIKQNKQFKILNEEEDRIAKSNHNFMLYILIFSTAYLLLALFLH